MSATLRPQPVQVVWPPGARRGTYYRLPNSPAALNAVAEHLTGADRSAARRYQHQGRRRAYLIASGLLRFALAEVLGRPPGRIALERRPQRRPRVLSPRWAGGVALSVAHTDRWVLVGVLPGRSRLGVDMEPAGRQPAANLAKKLPWTDDINAAELLQRWTLVEAALKAHGRGLAGLSDLKVIRAVLGGWQFESAAWRVESATLKGLSGYPRDVGAIALARQTREFKAP